VGYYTILRSWSVLAEWIMGCGLLHNHEIVECISEWSQVILGYTGLTLVLTARPHFGEHGGFACMLGAFHVHY
jgi:hypothetical protein